MRNSASDKAALKAIDLNSEAQAPAVSQELRRYRSSQPRLALPLPAYDVRVRRELAHRRTLVALARRIFRVLALHLLDAGVTAGAALLALRILPVPVTPETLALLVGLVIVGLEGRSAYQAGEGRRDPWRIVSGVALSFIASLMVARFAPTPDLAVEFITLFSIFAVLGILLERAVVDAIVRQVYFHGVGLRRAILVGRAADAEMLIAALKNDQQKDHIIVGHVVPGAHADAAALGTLVDLEEIIAKQEPAELILGSPLSAEAYRRVADICMRNGVAILAIPTWTKFTRGWAEPVRVGGLPAHWIHPVKLEVPSLVLKRAMDFVLTLVLLIVCIPLMALVALAIKIDSPGPVFFRQRRVGLGGREFTMWKFRSMEHMSERRRDDIAHLNHYQDARLFKLKQDPRITRVGRLLRRFSLDELPQLFNVLAGEMSLVGPRPPLPKEVVKYEQRHFIRLTVVPGMTGPWQTSGRNLITDFEEVVRIERAYIEQWSLGLDLKIMAKTLAVMISGEGAY